MQGKRDELLSMLQTITGWSREEVRAAFGRSGTAGGRRTNAAAGTPAAGSTQIHAEKARPKHARVEG